MMSPLPKTHDGPGAFDVRGLTQKRFGLAWLKCRRGTLSVSFAFAVTSWAGEGAAQSHPVIDLQWVSPPQCPSVSDVQQRIRDITGDVIVPPERLRADGQIARNGEKYRLVLVITSGTASGTRVLESESCEHLSGAAAVALGILVRVASNAEAPLTPDVLGEPTTDPHAPNQPPKETSPVPPGAAPTPTPKPAELGDNAKTRANSGAAVDVHLRLPSVRAALGIAPGVTLGYGLAVGAGYLGWEARLTGTYWMQRDVQSRWPGYGAQLKQASADLDVCRMWKRDALEGGPCVRMALARVTARGTGAGMEPKTATAVPLSAGAALAGRFHLSRQVALYVEGAAEFSASRPRVVNPMFGQIYEYPLVSAKFGLGAEWIF